MTKLPQKELNDLLGLALERTETAINSVAQLIDDPEQVHLLMMGIIASLCFESAEFMSEHVADSNRIAPDVAYFRILSLLAMNGKASALKEHLRTDGYGR